KFLENCNLLASSTPEQLREHASKLDALISDWKAHKCVKEALARTGQSRCLFSKEQIEALLLDKRKGKLTIEKRAKYCTTASDVIDIFVHHLDLGLKNKDENEIVASGSRQSQFHVKLAEAGVNPKIINTWAKDRELIQYFNKIQRKRTKKRMANPDRIPIHFSLARVSKRLQDMDVSKISTRGDLADMIVILSIKPAEYKDGYSWYCTGYLKSRGEKKKNPIPKPLLSMEKNPECAKELLTWIQEAIKARKLHNPVFTESDKRNDTPFNEFLKQEPYKTLPGKLRDYGSKHASRIYGGPDSIPQYLSLLTRIALRQELDRLDAGDNYAIGNTESEESDSEPETSDSPKPQTQASSPSQTIKMNSMLAEIDAILAEIQK
ncbi:24065_t:CDS:2, partial [Dentiscutata erythropus]